MKIKLKELVLGKRLFWQVLISASSLLFCLTLVVFLLSFYPLYQQKQTDVVSRYQQILSFYTNQIVLALSEARSSSLQVSNHTKANYLLNEIEKKYAIGLPFSAEVSELRTILASALVSNDSLEAIQRYEINGNLIVEVGTKQTIPFAKKPLSFFTQNNQLMAIFTIAIRLQGDQGKEIIGYDRLYFNLDQIVHKLESASLDNKVDVYWFVKLNNDWKAVSTSFSNHLNTLPHQVLETLNAQDFATFRLNTKVYYFQKINNQQILVLGVKQSMVSASVWINLSHIPLTVLGFMVVFILLLILCLRSILSKHLAENAQLHAFAHYDNITNLPNRKQFEKVFSTQLDLAFTQNSKLALLYIDIDHFKHINDGFGHDFGDCLLHELAIRLKSNIRKTDFIARIGSDEFAIILNDIQTEENIRTTVNHLYSIIHQVIVIDAYPINIRASMGVAIYPDHAIDRQTLLKYADMTMYESKKAGGNSYCIFNNKIGEHYLRRIDIAKYLERAIINDEFYLVYQPIINLNNNKIPHFEVLLRWRNKFLGEVSPAEFIPVAEELKIIIEIGNWVIRQTFYQLRQWHDDKVVIYKPTISINLSAVQINNASIFLSLLQQTLEQLNLPKSNVTFEITETVIMENMKTTSFVLSMLKGMGFQVSIDDFGTGFCSLGYLKNTDVDYIKIDKFFIDDVLTNLNSRVIVESIIRLGHNLGSAIIAEGIETKEQYQLLKELKCDFIQGYYFSKPLSANDASAFIKNQIKT
ncbi:putative bifunctional diguanylate cyclase/phosphodiesterase [Fastidiosibacter lacustris]|uniref:putative bifunctional diguanylate cyclase/phosphodiesterase n=1 Tax=Fastidiosibacter lacustris TaxID=2056695 RepID=UPI000E340BA8|nr:bifunctional diguanylate cyclase/phosphodiesterase [Fastidiosibacter lacustris]